MKIISKIFGDPVLKEMKQLDLIVEQVNALEAGMEKLSDKELKAQTNKLKQDIELINKNKKILISNNEKLQKELNLLAKNKKLLIEINDKYQTRVFDLEKNQNDIKTENLNLNKSLILLNKENIKILEKKDLAEQKKLTLSNDLEKKICCI